MYVLLFFWTRSRCNVAMLLLLARTRHSLGWVIHSGTAVGRRRDGVIAIPREYLASIKVLLRRQRPKVFEIPQRSCVIPRHWHVRRILRHHYKLTIEQSLDSTQGSGNLSHLCVIRLQTPIAPLLLSSCQRNWINQSCHTKAESVAFADWKQLGASTCLDTNKGAPYTPRSAGPRIFPGEGEKTSE